MNALPNPASTPRPSQKGRPRRPRAKAVRRNRAAYRGKALETMTLLTINTFLIGVGAFTLIKLVPYQLSQQAKLQTLEQESAEAQQRLQKLKADYQVNTIPNQSQRLAEEQGHLVGEKKVIINWQQQH